jgi:sugar/nucleoside kinase (ribokinase family)
VKRVSLNPAGHQPAAGSAASVRFGGGDEEEFHIAGGSTDTLTALKNVRNATKATLVCKRGPMGCVVLEGDIPDSWDSVPLQQGVRVEVLNVLGAAMPLCPACCAAG